MALKFKQSFRYLRPKRLNDVTRKSGDPVIWRWFCFKWEQPIAQFLKLHVQDGDDAILASHLRH